mmetsp:Transcript_6876/g.13079  ORF Transcript_6876/g.13079 Transcript_6876/m.13079 type:complete len:80 (-) Transcript_6876:445-684(-)
MLQLSALGLGQHNAASRGPGFEQRQQWSMGGELVVESGTRKEDGAHKLCAKAANSATDVRPPQIQCALRVVIRRTRNLL